jgi:hypothetical protein
MGYSMQQMDQSFFIKDEHRANVIKAIIAIPPNKSGYAWVDDTFRKNTDLYTLFNKWRWDISIGNGSIHEIYFNGEKSGDDLVLFEAIAPYVHEGSFIQMVGENGAIWRWSFKNKECTEIYPQITW